MADLTYTSGTHTVTSAFETLYVSGTAIVNLNAGASGSGHAAVIDLMTPANTEGAIPAIVNNGGTVNVNAGAYTGGAGLAAPDAGEAAAPAPAIWSRGGTLNISGSPTFAPGAAADRSGFPAADIGAPNASAISGGTFTAGNAVGSYNLPGGSALVAGIIGAVGTTLTGVTVSGGTGVGTGSTGWSLGFCLFDTTSHMQLTTGTFTGAVKGTMAATGCYLDVYTAVGVTPSKLDGTAFTDTTTFYGDRYTF